MKRGAMLIDKQTLFMKGLQKCLELVPHLSIRGIHDKLFDDALLTGAQVVLVDQPVVNRRFKNMISQLKRTSNPKIIVFTDTKRCTLLKDLYNAGVDGVVDKELTMDEVINLLKMILKYGDYYGFPSRTFKTREPALNDQERAMIELIACEKTTKEIAEDLCLSVRSVEVKKRALKHKLGARNSVGIVTNSIKRKILELSNQVPGESKGTLSPRL